MIEWGHKLGLRPFNHSFCLYHLPSYPAILSHAYSISRLIVLWWKDLTCKSAIAHYCGLLCAPSLLSLKLCAPQSHSLVTMTQLYSKSEKFPLFFSPPPPFFPWFHLVFCLLLSYFSSLVWVRARHWTRESRSTFCLLLSSPPLHFFLSLFVDLWGCSFNRSADWRESWWVNREGELVKRFFQKYFLRRISDLILFQ